MRIWKMESYPIGDRRMPHHLFPPKLLSIDQLHQLTGVVQYKIDLNDTNAVKKRLSRVKKDLKVVQQDIFILDENVTKFEQKSEELYEPVKKDEETVSLILEGKMYYDVEYEEDQWIRMQLEKGDLIVIPKGVCFRSTTTSQNFVKIQRFSKDTTLYDL